MNPHRLHARSEDGEGLVTSVNLYRLVHPNPTGMEIPQSAYTQRSFQDYLLDNPREVFGEEVKKKWLKVYCLFAADGTWRQSLFAGAEVRDFGEVVEVKLRNPPDYPAERRDENYYILEPSPGLLLCYTSATKESYEKTLAERIRRTIGVTQMHIRRGIFERVSGLLLEEYGGDIYRFTRRRGPMDSTPAEKRGGYARRFNYTGDDATFVAQELKETYGVSPTSLYIRINDNLTVQITNDGLFSARAISELALDVFAYFLNTVKEEVLSVKNTSQKLKFEVKTVAHEDGPALKVASIETGVIQLRAMPLDAFMVDRMVKHLKESEAGEK